MCPHSCEFRVPSFRATTTDPHFSPTMRVPFTFTALDMGCFANWCTRLKKLWASMELTNHRNGPIFKAVFSKIISVTMEIMKIAAAWRHPSDEFILDGIV